jgi:phage FluMu protein Com
MTPLAGQVHACWKCARRLPVDNILGSVVVLCPKCKTPNQIQVAGTTLTRERC